MNTVFALVSICFKEAMLGLRGILSCFGILEGQRIVSEVLSRVEVGLALAKLFAN